MVKKLILLNLALLLAATWLVYRLDNNLKRDAGRGDVSKIKTQAGAAKKPAVKSTPEAGKEKDKPANGAPPAPAASWDPDYKVVVDKNLFSEDRLPFKAEKEEVKAPPIPELNPKPVLVGILKTDDKRVAYLEAHGTATSLPNAPSNRYQRSNPTAPNPMAVTTLPSGGRRELAQPFEVGQEYRNGYKVTAIADTSVTLAYNGNQRVETIHLFKKDGGSRGGARPPISTPTAANMTPQHGQVVTIGGGPTAPAAIQPPGANRPPGVPTGQPGSLPNQPNRPGVNPVTPTNPVNSITPAGTPAATTSVAPTVQPVAPVITTPATSGGATSGGTPSERVTPWGKIKTRQ